MIAGLCMAKDEADIITYTVEHMLTQVDVVVVYDNLSTDGTGDLARDAGAIVYKDHEIGYRQSQKMTKWAYKLWHEGADWIVPFDADEAWFAHEGTVKGALRYSYGDACSARYWNFRSTSRDNADEPNPLLRMQYREADHHFQKVACHWQANMTLDQGNHYAFWGPPKIKGGDKVEEIPDLLHIRHYPYRSEAQFLAKVLNGVSVYRAAPELNQAFGKHWRELGMLAMRSPESALVQYKKLGVFNDKELRRAVLDPWPEYVESVRERRTEL